MRNNKVNDLKIECRKDERQEEPKKKKDHLKEKLFGFLKLIVMMSAVVVLTTLAVDATDNMDNLGNSLVGSAVGIGGENKSRCPEGMVYVTSGSGSFCIDAYTASASGDCPNPEPSSQSETRDNLSASGCKPVSKADAIPWRYISQTQAQDACRKAGKFLPDNEKWFIAARGTPSDGPWDSESCNLDNNWSESPGPTGSGKDCLSYAGSFDQVGNTWEWVSNTVRDGVMDGQTLPETGYITSVDTEGVILETDPDKPNENYNGDWLWIKSEGTRGVMRGGFFGSRSDGGVYSFHAEMTPDFAGRAVGFRCVSEPAN